MVEPYYRTARRLRDHVVVHQRRTGAGDDRNADPGEGLADHIAGDRDIAQIFAPARDDAEGGRILDHVAGDGSVGLDIDADAGVVIGRGPDRALRQKVADDVALDHRNAAAFVEIADGDAERRAVHRVAGDDGGLEREFRIQRDLADV